MTQTWWLSFCDEARPEGQRFLGVAVIDVTEIDVARATGPANALRAAHGLPPMTEAHDHWMAGAISKAHRVKANPGGSVLASRVDDIATAAELAGVPRDRLLQRPELEAIGVPVRMADGDE